MLLLLSALITSSKISLASNHSVPPRPQIIEAWFPRAPRVAPNRHIDDDNSNLRAYLPPRLPRDRESTSPLHHSPSLAMVLADLGKRLTSAVSNLTHSNVVDEKARSPHRAHPRATFDL